MAGNGGEGCSWGWMGGQLRCYVTTLWHIEPVTGGWMVGGHRGGRSIVVSSVEYVGESKSSGLKLRWDCVG